ncbi:XdhC family protein [candidate division KSB1 bacterium]|nr:XdhC family protein [candidate division KSB1 bacterium]
MSSIDIYKKICRLLEEGRSGVLATIIKTRGSTPAGALSKMVVLEGGSNIIGTVGGGCVEAEVITESKSVYKTGIPCRNTYDMTEDDVEGGLICGGTVDILLEPMNKTMLPVYKELLDSCIKGTDSVLGTILSNGSAPEKFLITDGEAKNTLPYTSEIQQDISSRVNQIISSGKTEILTRGDSEIIMEPVTGLYTVVLFGGGHVSRYVAEIAQKAGYAVTIVDDRLKYASRKRFPDVEKLVCADFKESFSKITFNEKTYIVIVTRGHAHDEVVLEEAVKTNAGYIGMIGSKRKIAKSYDNLQKRGVDPDELQKVFAPLGFDIGSQTAEEIAVSIVAELINVRHRNDGKPVRHFKDRMNYYFERINAKTGANSQ